MTMLPKIKIVATLGPASSSEKMIASLISVGINVVRLIFLHGSTDEYIARAAIVRNIAPKLGRPVCVLWDLQDPKISKFELGKVSLKNG